MFDSPSRRRALRLGGLAVAVASAGCLSRFGNEPGGAAVGRFRLASALDRVAEAGFDGVEFAGPPGGADLDGVEALVPVLGRSRTDASDGRRPATDSSAVRTVR